MNSIFKNQDFSWIIMDSLLKNQEGSFQKEIIKGKSIKIENRTIYPIIQVLTIEIEDKFSYESLIPIAIAVVESDDKYLISLDEENEEITQLLNKENIWDELGL